MLSAIAIFAGAAALTWLYANFIYRRAYHQGRADQDASWRAMLRADPLGTVQRVCVETNNQGA